MLSKVCVTGSEATHCATVIMAFGKDRTVCCGIGSHVGGSNSPHQELSTIHFDLREQKMCHIADPNNVSKKATAVAVPLPHHVLDEEDKDCDNKCLEFIEKQCHMFKIIGKPIVALVMELMLAGNGAVLSKHFLEELGHLGEKYEFHLIVDEIFTGGRTCDDSMFLTLSKHCPQSFQKIVSQLILGKWTGTGLCCSRPKFLEKFGKTSNRAFSNHAVLPLSETIRAMDGVVERMENGHVTARRVELIDHLMNKKPKSTNFTEESCWGLGAALYCPLTQRGGMEMKNRHSPKLEINEKFDLRPLVHDSNWTRESTNKKIKKAIETWMEHLEKMCSNDPAGCCFFASKFLFEVPTQKDKGRIFTHHKLAHHLQTNCINIRKDRIDSTISALKTLGHIEEMRTTFTVEEMERLEFFEIVTRDQIRSMGGKKKKLTSDAKGNDAEKHEMVSKSSVATRHPMDWEIPIVDVKTAKIQSDDSESEHEEEVQQVEKKIMKRHHMDWDIPIEETEDGNEVGELPHGSETSENCQEKTCEDHLRRQHWAEEVQQRQKTNGGQDAHKFETEPKATQKQGDKKKVRHCVCVDKWTSRKHIGEVSI